MRLRPRLPLEINRGACASSRRLCKARARRSRGSVAGPRPPTRLEDASEVADARALCERRRALVDEWDAGPEQREAWLHDYHAWLRALPPLLPEDLAGASVELRERVRLMEAAVLVQAEVLEKRTTATRTAARGGELAAVAYYGLAPKPTCFEASARTPAPSTSLRRGRRARAAPAQTTR